MNRTADDRKTDVPTVLLVDDDDVFAMVAEDALSSLSEKIQVDLRSQ